MTSDTSALAGMVTCPICGKSVKEAHINRHIDSSCSQFVDPPSPPPSIPNHLPPRSSQAFFSTPAKRVHDLSNASTYAPISASQPTPIRNGINSEHSRKADIKNELNTDHGVAVDDRPAKKTKLSIAEKVAPLAERMRPQTLDEVYGQDLVGPDGVLRNLIESDRVPSMILWGGPGTGKTTISRLIAQTAGTRFVEINSTSSGVGECKKLFSEAKNELALTGRKTIIFCDEIHRFSKSQQDVFLGPVEAGHVTLIGATTENPSFKVINALLSRCRTFTLSKLSDEHILSILKRALDLEPPRDPTSLSLLRSDDYELLRYLATFSDGDARTALNLLSLALDLSTKPSITMDAIKSALTKTLVYDRAGDQHYDTISAFHKSVRGSDPDAALYYLARMLQSGEDPLFIARRMVVIASEDVGLADNTLLSLATAAYTAAEKIGMPECRINLAHCCVALCLAPKSTRSYKALGKAMEALQEPGIAGLPIPLHVRNAPTRLMKEMNYGKGYKYNPRYEKGQVLQDYLPEKLVGRHFLEEDDLGHEVDEDLVKFREMEKTKQQTFAVEEMNGQDEDEKEPDGITDAHDSRGKKATGTTEDETGSNEPMDIFSDGLEIELHDGDGSHADKTDGREDEEILLDPDGG